jgi:hypothetical protein
VYAVERSIDLQLVHPSESVVKDGGADELCTTRTAPTVPAFVPASAPAPAPAPSLLDHLLGLLYCC